MEDSGSVTATEGTPVEFVSLLSSMWRSEVEEAASASGAADESTAAFGDT